MRFIKLRINPQNCNMFKNRIRQTTLLTTKMPNFKNYFPYNHRVILQQIKKIYPISLKKRVKLVNPQGLLENRSKEVKVREPKLIGKIMENKFFRNKQSKI